MKKRLISVSVITFILLMCFFPNQLITAAGDSLCLWYLKVLPSLFPFTIAINILGEIGFAQFIGRKLSPITKVMFRVNGCGSFSFILGSLAGFPSGAKATNDLYKKGLLTLKEAQCVLAFSNNPGPIFVISTVGISFLGNQNLGYIILTASIISSLIVGFIFGLILNPSKESKTVFALNKTETLPLGSIISNSILSAANTLVVIGGCIMLFGIIIRSLYIFNILSDNNQLLSGLIAGLLEMTTGTSIIGSSNMTMLAKVVICAFILNFGGASIQLQILSASCDIPYNKPLYFTSQILKAILAALICACIYTTI